MSPESSSEDKNHTERNEGQRTYRSTPGEKGGQEGGTTLSTEEWIQELNKADSFDSYLRKKKKFKTARPRGKAIKLLRSQGQHYLLNRARAGIEKLLYKCRTTGDFGRDGTSVETFELTDLPPKSFVGIGSVPGEAQRTRAVAVTDVTWSDGKEGGSESKMRQWSPHDSGTAAPNLDLRYVPRIPTVGTVGLGVHAVIENIVRQGVETEKVSTDRIRRALADAREQVENQQDKAPEEVTPGMVETAYRMVDRFLASSLAKDVRAADQVFAEYPFSTVIDSGPTRVERGSIDLVYQDAEGWHIVDYKTDQVAEGPLEEGPLDVPDYHKYARQVHRYADAWESVAGEPVADAALWFADVDATVSIR